jgi:hypothetical protein
VSLCRTRQGRCKPLVSPPAVSCIVPHILATARIVGHSGLGDWHEPGLMGNFDIELCAWGTIRSVLMGLAQRCPFYDNAGSSTVKTEPLPNSLST